MRHVSQLRGNTAKKPGQCNLSDAVIAQWCATKETVLVTIDAEFRDKWVKSGLLAKHGVETIVFAKDLEGIHEQHLQVTACLPRWEAALGANSYGHRVWVQRATGDPQIQLTPRGPRRQ